MFQENYIEVNYDFTGYNNFLNNNNDNNNKQTAKVETDFRFIRRKSFIKQRIKVAICTTIKLRHDL